MTEVELFPRGKTSAHGDSNLVSKKKLGDETGITRAEVKKGRKRKATVSPLVAGSDQDKDWLFGAPQTKRAVATGGKSDGKSGGRQPSQPPARKNVKAFIAEAKEKGLGMVIEQPGRPPRLENVSFRNLSKGTLVLGVVLKVMTHEMMVSLPTGLTGVVHWEEVSDQFYFEAAAARDKIRPSGNTSEKKQLGERINGSIPLTDLFRTGQVVRCAVVDLAKKGGNRRIILSLRSSVVNKGLSMSQLGKGCGVCGSVASSEDHGYVVTLGLEGITAFLPTKYAPDRGLRIGQPVETVVKAVRASARTVTLSTEASLVASAVTSGTSFDLRSLKPGMLVDATVERVLSNGIVVSFLGSFVGCVDHNNMPVLCEDDKSENSGWRSLFKSRTGSVRARIAMVDYPNKAIRLTLRPHLVGMLPPVGLPPVGATLEGTVVRIDPTGLLLTVPSSNSNASATIVSSSKDKTRQKADGTDESVQADALESGGVVGAFVHISRVAEEKVDDLEKLFKLGQKVSCRTTGSLLFEGWAAATINPSVVSSAIFRYQDLSLGATVEGTVTSVVKTGLVVKIGEGVQAWVPKIHVADVAIKDIVAKFKVGAIVKGRVLLIDASRKKASLTLKPSMVKDKRHLIVSYKHVKIGAACMGFVIKVTRSYLHVGFYGNTFGVLSAGALALHGIMDPTSEFAVGQVVGCIVDSCDSSKKPPMLRLMLDVAGKTEEIGKAADEEKTSLDGGNDVKCPSPGDIVTGTVAETQDVENAVVIHLSVTPKSSSDNDGNGKPSHVRGVLPYMHLGDHASLCNKTLVKKLTPGTEIERVLVLSVDKHGVSTVSLKPLLISSVLDPSRCGGAFMPREVFDISYGDLLVGYVSEVKKFGVFVSFLGGFTGLCPREMVGGRQVNRHRTMLKGDSVRCVVRRVNERIGQVTVTFDETSFPPSPALYIHSFLHETFAADPSWEGLKFGSTVNAKVIGLKKYGVVLRKVDAKGSGAAGSGDGAEEGAGRLMVCPPEHAMGGLEEGNEVKVRVLGVDISKGVVDVTMDTDLVKAGRAKRQKAMAPLHRGDSVRAKVVLAKPNEKWAVAASAEGRLFVLQVADFHCPFRTCQEAGLSTKDSENNEEFDVDAVVGGDFGQEVKGWYEAIKDESEDSSSSSRGNPYSGALMIVAKNYEGPKQKAPELEPVVDGLNRRDESDVIAANLMDRGRVALDEIVKGTKVVCKVTAVKLERLEVEIAVGPRSDGPESSREELTEGKEGESPSTEGVHKGDDAEGITDSLGPVDGSKTVRIRGRVHCTAAGLPGVDAPHSAEVDDGWLLHEWHPLQKYKVGEVLEARVLYTEDVPSAKAGGHVLRLVELAVVRRLGDGDGKEDGSVSTVSDVVRWGANPPKQGQAYRGVIKFVTDRGVLVWLSSHIEGFIAKTVLGVKDEAMLQSMFKVGMGVRVVVRDANEKRTNVVLSLQGESTKGVKKTGKTKRPSPGDIVEGVIDLKEEQGNPSVMVRLDGGFSGRVCFTELDDEENWRDDPLSRLKDGERLKFRVLGERIRGKTGKWASPLELSLRSSRLLPTLDRKEAIKRVDPPDVFSVVKGYVEGLRSGGGLAVRLDGNVLGRVRMKDLSDTFVANPTEEFPTGRLVVAKVTEKDETSGKLWLTLQRSVVEERLSWKSKGLVKGVKVKGRISAVKDFGVFVQLDHSKVHGLCHIEEIADHPIKDLSEMFHKGDRITAVVLRMDARKRRLSLGLKESHFKGVDDISDKKGKTKKDHDDKENNDENGDSDAMEESDGERESSKRSRDVFESGLGNAFSLDFGESGSSGVRAGSGSSSEEEEEDEGDSDDGGEGFGNAGHRSRKKAREKREEEERIAARERALENDSATPETVGDFERLLMASPNNSLLWVKYMAFKLSLADVEGARAVVERGLKAVSFRQERERFNLWVSYMNLEHKFGNRTSLKAVFERACENSDPTKVFLHLAEVHRKAQETEQCEEIFQAAVKKFRESHEVWMAFQLARIKRGDDAGAREILQRSLQSLRKGTHLMVISRYAQNEFEHGSIERGRLVFEGLLASYPRRVDIWNVYIAKEVKKGDIRAARNLHDRLTRMEFKARRMKGVFKSYLEFEMNHGDDARVEAVKAKAKDYVMSLGA